MSPIPLAGRLATLLALLLATVAVRAQTYVGVIDPEGTPLLHDLDWRGGQLYATDTRINRIVTVNTETGGIAQLVGLAFEPRGLAFDGTDYRVSTGFDASDPEIFTITEGGTQTGSIPAPSDLTNGLTFHDGLLWAARADPDEEAAIVGLDPTTGDIVETIAFPSTQPTGIAFLGDGTLWASNAGDDSGSNGTFTLYHIDRATGAVIETLGVPDGTRQPRGLAFDGESTLYLNVREVSTALIYVIDLDGSGNAEIELSDDGIDFGPVVDGETETRSLSITNTGDGDLVISDVSGGVIPENPGSFGTTLEPTTIAPGATETFQFSFTANRDGIDPRGEATGVFFLETNDVQNPTVEIPVGAFAADPDPTVYVLGDPDLDFGEVRIDPATALSLDTRSVLVQNVGARPLTFTEADAPEAFALYLPDLPFSIAPSEFGTLRVAFRPTATGPVSGTIRLTSNDPDSPLRLDVSGTGIDPDLTPGSPIWTHAVIDNPATPFDEPKVHALASPGDITGDGLADLVYATRSFLTVALDANGWSQPPVLWSFNTCPSNSNCGSVSGVNQLYETGLVTGVDLSGDGIHDVVIGTEGANDHVFALDGKTGDVLWEFGSDTDPFLGPYYSVSARPGMDATGDGIPEVASGTGTADPEGPDPFNNRRVYFFNGATGDVLWDVGIGLPNFRTVIYDPGQSLGLRVASGGGEDVANVLLALDAADGSGAWTIDPGLASFLIEPLPTDDGEDLVVAGNSTQVARFDGATGTEVWRRSVGGSVVWDLATLSREGSSPLVAVGHSGSSVQALDGEDGTITWSRNVGDQAFDLAVVPDADGDGREDVAAVGRSGTAYLLSGEDGAVIWTYRFGNGSSDEAGEVAVAVPDLDANGIPEVAFGTRDGRVILLFGGGGRVGTPTEGAPEAGRLALDAPFPSPSRGPVTLRYRLADAADVRLQVIDVLGREVWSRAARQSAGSYAFDVPEGTFAPGSYVVRLASGGEAFTRRFVVVR